MRNKNLFKEIKERTNIYDIARLYCSYSIEDLVIDIVEDISLKDNKEDVDREYMIALSNSLNHNFCRDYLVRETMLKVGKTKDHIIENLDRSIKPIIKDPSAIYLSFLSLLTLPASISLTGITGYTCLNTLARINTQSYMRDVYKKNIVHNGQAKDILRVIDTKKDYFVLKIDEYFRI